MNKLVFCSVPMREELHAQQYPCDGDSELTYNKAVIYPVNALMASTLKPVDNVRIVLMRKLDVNGNCGINAGRFMEELDLINVGIGADISYETIDSPFVETKNVHEQLFRGMIDKLSDNIEITADITYGPKPLPMVLFCALSFAEKFFNADIRSIVYGKVDFIPDQETGKTVPANPQLYDISSLYYLNSLTSSMESNSGEEAIAMIDSFFAL